jgi:hypothetical protein
MNLLKTTYRTLSDKNPLCLYVCPYLNGADIGVLCGILILVQAILGEFSFAKIDAEFDKKYHHRLEGGDGAVTGPLGDDMFVEELQGSLRLLDSDEFLRALSGGEVRRRGFKRVKGPTDRVFSGLECGGGAMLGSLRIGSDCLSRRGGFRASGGDAAWRCLCVCRRR